MDNGWIKIHRKIIEHWVYKNDAYFKAWICIIATVNHEDKKVFIHDEVIECKRGQSVLSLSSWVSLFGRGWSMQRVRTFFNLLQKDNMIIIEGLRKTTRLTVCKYDNYQVSQHTANTQLTHSQHTANNKQERKECKEEYIAPEFENVFMRWLKYKNERRQSYKTEDSRRAAYNKLIRLSGNSPGRAEQIVEQSLANNWAGLFDLKEEAKKIVSITTNKGPII